MPSDFNDLPNPFAQLASGSAKTPSDHRFRKPSRSTKWQPGWAVAERRVRAKRAVVQATKYLVAVAICFAVLLGIRHATGHWLLQQLTKDFAELPSDQQQQRLLEIEGLGKPAIPHLVDALAAEEISTARTAYELLRHSQNEWTAMRSSELQSRQLILAESIQSISAQLPDDRTGWAATLLQQSIMDSVHQVNEMEKSVYREANEALASLTLSTRSGSSIVDGEYQTGGILRPTIAISRSQGDDVAILRNNRLVVSPTPLPIEQDPGATRWSDWPPSADDATTKPTDQDRGGSPLYRSAAMQLRPVEPSDPVILRPVELPVETSFEVAATDIAPVNHDVELLLDAYDDHSVMHWLVSPHANLRTKAAIELQSRGYTDRQLELARHMVHGDTEVRLAFLDRVSRDHSVDPRPWLRMMVDDKNREVRLRVVSILATMNDHSAEDYLRTLMAQERDPIVAARIRRVLKLR